MRRPEVGDSVEFLWRGVARQGVIVAVAVTGVHFTVEVSEGRIGWKVHGKLHRFMPVPLSRITEVFEKDG